MNRTISRAPALTAGELLDLIERSRGSLLAACHAPTTSERYAHAQTGALRAAAALLASVAPRTMGSRPRSAWEAVAAHAPDLAERAAFFAGAGRRSRAAEAGLRTIGLREADDLIREAESFLDAVLVRVGLPAVPTVTAQIVPATPR